MLMEEDEKLDRFALHQHLPTGDFFTSAAKLSASEAASLVTGMSVTFSSTPTLPNAANQAKRQLFLFSHQFLLIPSTSQSLDHTRDPLSQPWSLQIDFLSHKEPQRAAFWIMDPSYPSPRYTIPRQVKLLKRRCRISFGTSGNGSLGAESLPRPLNPTSR